MALRKSQGNKKGKQLPKKQPVPQVSPPQSFLDKESWPIWQQLQNKIAALKAARSAKTTLQSTEVHLHRSARESKGHRRAKLRTLANILMTRFAILEAEQQLESTAGKEVEGTLGQATHRDTDDDRSTPITVMSAMPTSGRQETSGEVSWGNTDGRDEPLILPSSGGFPSIHNTSSHFPAWPGPSMVQAPTHDMAISFTAWPWTGSSLTSMPSLSSTLPAWPWPGSDQFNLQPYPAGNTQASGAFSASWPYMSAHLGGWAAPLMQSPAPALVTPAAGVGVWPYPSVLDTGYNTVPLQALPFGDHAMPLGNHLTPVTKKKI
ncbi:uncharacterized protein LOC144588466 [Pogona vitticeps]